MEHLAINFNGTASFTPRETLPSFGSTFCVEMWIKPNTLTQKDYSCFIMRGNGGTANGLVIVGQKIGWRSNQVGGLGQSLDDFTEANYPIGKWTHIAISVSSNTFNYFRNGSLITSGTLPATPNTTTAVTIGDWSPNYGSQFHGAISEMRVWNITRSQSEIKANMSLRISNSPNLVARFKLEDDSEGTINGSYLLEPIEVFYKNKILISSNSGGLRSIEKKDDMETAIPIMSSNTTPSGVASASSYNNDDQPWKAFDKGTVARSLWFTNQTPPTGGHWIQYEFSASKVVNKIAITTSVITTGFYGVRSFKFLGSNDGVNFELLFSGVQVDNPNRQEYVFENNKKYKTYRLNVVDSYQGTNSALINELEMFGFDMNFISFSEQAQINENLFLKYGANQQSLSNIDSIFEGVKSVSLNTTALGDGKIYTHTLDLRKYAGNRIALK